MLCYDTVLLYELTVARACSWSRTLSSRYIQYCTWHAILCYYVTDLSTAVYDDDTVSYALLLPLAMIMMTAMLLLQVYIACCTKPVLAHAVSNHCCNLQHIEHAWLLISCYCKDDYCT